MRLSIKKGHCTDQCILSEKKIKNSKGFDRVHLREPSVLYFAGFVVVAFVVVLFVF